MFSIVIPSKNEERNIGTLLRSIRDQTIQPERIVVSDKSKDRTREIARSFNTVVVEGQDDGLVGRARNKGAVHTNGDIIIFLDADVELPTVTFLEDIITCMEALDIDIATCYYNPSQRNARTLVLFGLINVIKRLDGFFKTGLSGSGGCLAIRKNVFEAVGGFNEAIQVSEDAELSSRVRRNGYDFAVLPLWITVSTRRFTRQSFPSFIRTCIGGASTHLGQTFSIGWLKGKGTMFEKWYGEMGEQAPTSPTRTTSSSSETRAQTSLPPQSVQYPDSHNT